MIQPPAPVAPDAPAPRVGVFVCQCGGNISDVVDTQRVAATAQHLPGVVVSHVHAFLCSEAGQVKIAEEIRQAHLDRVVVASCSPFLHELTFRTAVERGGLNPYLYEHVNIREQVSWAHPKDPGGATAKAIRLIAAAVHRLHHVEPLVPIRLPNHRRALVIGGGIAGLKAAGDLAAKGVDVVLVEQGPNVGGRVTALSRLFPTEESADALLQRLITDVRNHPRIELLIRTRVRTVSGFLGNYEVTLEREPAAAGTTPSPNPTACQRSVGALIVATGFDYYRPGEGEYGFGRYAPVMTLPEFIGLLARLTGDALRWEGRPVRSVGFLHCVGSRQLEGVHPPSADGKLNEYCSRVCCTTILHQALAAKRRLPHLTVFDFHQDIRTYGRGHEDYYRQASQAGVVFFRFHGDDPPLVEAGTNGSPLQVRLHDWLTWGEEVVVPLDLLVLAVGLTPRANADLIQKLKIPTGADRFLQEVHPKLRPVETSVNGILLAGTAQAPMTIVETLASASAAAAKAAVLLAHDEVALEPFKARVDPDQCIGCGRCFPECAYEGALMREEGKREGQPVTRARVNPGLCVGCGACVPVCPTRAIDLQGWTLRQFESMIDGLLEPTPPAAAQTESLAHDPNH